MWILILSINITRLIYFEITLKSQLELRCSIFPTNINAARLMCTFVRSWLNWNGILSCCTLRLTEVNKDLLCQVWNNSSRYWDSEIGEWSSCLFSNTGKRQPQKETCIYRLHEPPRAPQHTLFPFKRKHTHTHTLACINGPFVDLHR